MSAPRFINAIVNGAGTKVILTYSETLSSTTANTSAFAVTVGGNTVSITSAEVIGSTIELTLGSQVDHAPVKVSYRSSGSNDINAIQNLAGNDAPSLNNRGVRNLRGFTTYTENNEVSGHTGSTFQESRISQAFAALKDDGSVVTWGNQTYGGDSSTVSSSLSSGVSQIYATNYAFAALKDDGSVVT